MTMCIKRAQIMFRSFWKFILRNNTLTVQSILLASVFLSSFYYTWYVLAVFKLGLAIPLFRFLTRFYTFAIYKPQL